MERFNRLLLFFLLWMLLSDSCRAAKLAAPNELSESEVSGFASSPYSSSCYGLSSNLGRLAAAVERIGQQQEHQPRSGRLFRGASVEDRLEELQGQVEALQEEISTLKRIGEGGQGDRVFFNVLRQRKLVCYGCIVSFDAASADTHDAFDLSTGTFVAPIGGHYFFQFHALVEDRYEAQVEILVNGVDVIHLYDRDVNGANRRYAMVGQSFIRRLRAGDAVKVRLHKGALKGGGAATTYTSFVGVLLGGETGGGGGSQGVEDIVATDDEENEII